VTTGRERDRMLDAHLRRALTADAVNEPSAACLDAETLSAWIDGGLDVAAAATAEAHVSSCARCQAMVGVMAHTAPSPQPAEVPWWRGWMGWLVPVAATAAALGVWMVVPSLRTASTSTPTASPAGESLQAIAPSTPAAQPPAAVGQSAPEAPRESQELKAVPAPARLREQAAADARKDQAVAGAKVEEQKLEDRAASNEAVLAKRPEPVQPSAALAEPPAPPGVAAPQALGRALRQESSADIVSPDPAIRWRIVGGGAVDSSSNGGASWERVTLDAPVDVTAGSAPSPSVCWLVGRGGSVWITTDGRNWRRVTFPEPVDLAGVRATDANTAAVTSTDGRVFRTTDGGATWR